MHNYVRIYFEFLLPSFRVCHFIIFTANSRMLLSFHGVSSLLFFCPSFRICFAFVILFTSFFGFACRGICVFLIYAYREYRKNLKRNWTKELKEVSHSLYDITPDEVIHLILVPMYKESVDVLRDTMNAIADSTFRKNRFLYVSATEEQDAKMEETMRMFSPKNIKEFWKIFG